MRLVGKVLLTAVVVALLFTGSFLEGTASAQTITVALGADAVNLDPHTTNDQPSARVRRQIYETLIVQGEDLEFYPGLATAWEQIDELTYEFTLREGVQFHNGDTFNAHDVKYTFERLLDPATAADAAFLLETIGEVEVVNDYKVRITTTEPFGPLYAHLAHPVAAIVNQKAIEAAGDDYGLATAVGTGAFKFQDWVSQSHITLVRNDNYWGELAKSEQLVFRPIPETSVRVIELQTGGVDIAYDLDPQGRLEVESDPNIVLYQDMSLSNSYIGFNANKHPFDDPLVRQALNYAVDVEVLLDVIYEGQASKADGPLPSLVFGFKPDLTAYEYDPEKAKELLQQAGYAPGFLKTSIWTNDSTQRMQIAEVVQQNLVDVGIDATIEVLEWGAYLENTGAGMHDMFILGWVTVTADADYGLYALFHSSQFGSAGNRTYYANDRVDELLELARSTSDAQTRLEAYYEIQDIIVEEAPWIFLFSPDDVHATRANIEGFTPHPAGHHYLAPVTKQ